MLEDILEFQVQFYSPDGKSSPVIKYLLELFAVNPEFAQDALDELILLPETFYLFNHKKIKNFKTERYNFYELRVRYKNNICRFFFILIKPNIVVFFGFTKKTQRTDQKHIRQSLKYLDDYLNKKSQFSFQKISLTTDSKKTIINNTMRNKIASLKNNKISTKIEKSHEDWLIDYYSDEKNKHRLLIKKSIMRLAISLKKQRELAGVSQRQLAEKTGVAQSTIVKIERGESASMETICKISLGLGVIPDFSNFLHL
jgi:DNA-binding XRE family transcriptional regulator/phage-related protein